MIVDCAGGHIGVRYEAGNRLRGQSTKRSDRLLRLFRGGRETYFGLEGDYILVYTKNSKTY